MGCLYLIVKTCDFKICARPESDPIHLLIPEANCSKNRCFRALDLHAGPPDRCLETHRGPEAQTSLLLPKYLTPALESPSAALSVQRTPSCQPQQSLSTCYPVPGFSAPLASQRDGFRPQSALLSSRSRPVSRSFLPEYRSLACSDPP
jgi:hypothetical protein